MARDSSRTPFRGKIPLYLFHEKRTAEDWMKFSRVVLFVCAWWGQPEAPHLEGDDMKTATRALAKEEERKSGIPFCLVCSCCHFSASLDERAKHRDARHTRRERKKWLE